MNEDNKNSGSGDEPDDFYETGYDDDAIDYDLDSDKLLEEEIPPESEWGSGPESAYATPSELPLEEGYDESAEQQYHDPDNEEWYDEEEDALDDGELAQSREGEYIDSWPLGLIAVGIVALLLLAAGGYGVLQQRTAMQEEIRQLRATLATTTSNTELAASRQAQRTLASHNAELETQVERLVAENEALRARLKPTAPVETPPGTDTPKPKSSPAKEKLPASESAQPSPPTSAAGAEPKPEKKLPPQQLEKKPVTAPSQGNWFVNFGSYTQRAVADQWAGRLKVDTGRVVVVSADRGGTRYYRVRVVDLPNREIAGKIARQLEQTHKLPRLWVGEQ